MSIVEVKVPQLSESVAEATMLQWKKQPGEAVALDEILIEIETDKVVLEVPAPAAGVLVAHVAGDGATVTAEQVIGRIDTDAKAAAAPAAPPAASPQAAMVAQAPASKAGVSMPAAAKLMADNQLVAGSVAGSGRDGRVTKGDVLGALAAPAANVAAPLPAVPAPAKALPIVAPPSMPSLACSLAGTTLSVAPSYLMLAATASSRTTPVVPVALRRMASVVLVVVPRR